MGHKTWAALAAVLLAGCMPQEPAAPPQTEGEGVVAYMPTPEGWPWKMGEMGVRLDGVETRYTTWDYSIGALDGGVQLRWEPDADHSVTPGGPVHLLVSGVPGEDGRREAGAIYVNAVFPEMPKAGAVSRDVSVEWRLEADWKGRVLRSDGPAELRVEAITRKGDETSTGQIRGTVQARLCEAMGESESLAPGGACHDFSASFDSRLQYDM